jgi:transcriptional regulator with XRE-family HTH domain
MKTRITTSEGYWIKYLMSLRNLTQETIANRAGCTASMVSHILHGRKTSVNVCTALAKALGFRSFDELIVAANREGVA